MTDPPPRPQSPDVNALRLEDDDLVPRPARAPLSEPSPPPVAERDFRTIFEGECTYVWNALRRLGVYERDLEDVMHDVFVTVYRRLADYDPTRPIRPWLFGIAFRVASDYRRLARHRREVVGDAFDHPDPGPSAHDHYATMEARKLVMEALEVLDWDRRAVFVMHELDGHAMPEIAAALSVPLNTAYSRLRLAREQFAGAVKRIRAGVPLRPLKTPLPSKPGGAR